MPVTTPQGTQYIGIDPNRTGRFGSWPATDQTSWERRRAARQARERFFRARRAERQYAVQLRRIAAQIGQIVHGIFNPNDPLDPGWQAIQSALDQYRRLLDPWASAAAARMIAEVDRRDFKAWIEHGREIGAQLQRTLRSAPVGREVAQLQQTQVALITSMPLNAAQRIQGLSTQAMTGGGRWEEIAREVMAQGQHSRSEANTIARTETARVQSNFTAVRAQHLGSEQFEWATANDRDVRPLHKSFAGKVYRWDQPPVLDDGRPGLPGTIYNCRCWAIPVLPEIPPAYIIQPEEG